MVAKTRSKRVGTRKTRRRVAAIGGNVTLLGEGGYGCIYHSSIPCVTYNENGSIRREYGEDPKYVSKLTSKRNAEKEMRENENIRLIDIPDLKTGEGRFSIYPFRLCYLTKSIYNNPEIKKQVLGCEYRKISDIRLSRNLKGNSIKNIDIESVIARNDTDKEEEKIIRKKNQLILELLDKDPKSIALLTMTLGGKDIFDIIVQSKIHTNMTKHVPDKININMILVLFMNILNGVTMYHMRNFYHLDLKPENIVYKNYKSEGRTHAYMKMIDFGLSTKLNIFDTEKNKYDLQMIATRPIDLFLIQNPLHSTSRYFDFPRVIEILKNINGGEVPKSVKEVRDNIKSIENLNKFKKINGYINNILDRYYESIENGGTPVPRHILYTRNSTGERVPSLTLDSILRTYHYYANKYDGDKISYTLYNDKLAKKEILEKVDVYGLSYFVALIIYGVFGYTMHNILEIHGSDNRVVPYIVKVSGASLQPLVKEDRKKPLNKLLTIPLLELAIKGMDMNVEKRITLAEFKRQYNDIIVNYIDNIYKPRMHLINSSSDDPDVKNIISFLQKNKILYTTIMNKYLKFTVNDSNNDLSISSDYLPEFGFVSLGEEYNLNNNMRKSKSYGNNNFIEQDPMAGKLTRLPSV